MNWYCFDFSAEEWALAQAEGERRFDYYSKRPNAKHNNWDGERSSLQLHLLGARGEMAVASYLGLKHQLYTEKTPVPESFDMANIDVKTRGKHDYDLILHVADRLEHKTFWLVTIENGETRIHGWLPGPECRDQKWVRRMGFSQQPCYLIPQHALRSPESGRFGF